MKLKKLLAFGLALVMCLAMAACAYGIQHLWCRILES